ncbi:MAG TPA: methyltransferase domain-containing protein, partial [Gemmatimonadaceae bacterium]|nr:methyltransferase domain-containing protein [Gemmatimonadaceae bacterium]
PYELTACPVCGSKEAVEVADRDAIVRERERLWEFHDRRLREGIPPARLMDRVAFSQEPPLRLVRCLECAHIYRNPREREEALGAAYERDAPEPDVLQKLFDTQREAYAAQASRLKDVAGESGRGLEVGSYAGGFLAAARDAGWDFQGADISERAAAFSERNGFVVTCGSIDKVIAARPLDAVAIWNTFEQLYDSRAAVTAARTLLRKGGTFVVRVPSGRFYERWRTRLDGPLSGVAERLLAHNNLLTFPYQQGFSRRSLDVLLSERGFQVVRVFGDTLVPIADEWTTLIGRAEERIVKRLEILLQHGWHAPWVEVYARAI